MFLSRRAILKGSGTALVLGGLGAPLVARAQSAEFSYKYANNLPDSLRLESPDVTFLVN